MKFLSIITWCVWNVKTTYTRKNNQILEEVSIPYFSKKRKKKKKKKESGGPISTFK